MSDFEISIPYRDRRDPLDLEAYDAAADTLEGEERSVAQHLLWEALSDPNLSTVGDLLDKVKQASPEERRQIADEARRALGMCSLSEAKASRALALAQRDDPPAPQQGPPRDHQGMAVQECAHPDCEVLSVNEITRVIGPVAARRWWCPVHESEAPEGDMDAWTPPPITYSPGGGLMSEQEAADGAAFYERLVAESREKALHRQEQNREERERLERLQELRAEQATPIVVGGIEIDGKGRVVNGPEQG